MEDSDRVENLRREFDAGNRPGMIFFWGHEAVPGRVTASCLSQWYDSPFEVDGHVYPTAEHFMMAEKAALFGDHEVREKILLSPSPAAAKALGRAVRGFDQPAWNRARFPIVVRASREKFSQCPNLRDYLIATGSRVLVQASPDDRIWGIGLLQSDPRAADPSRWTGLNLLGFALMEARENLRR